MNIRILLQIIRITPMTYGLSLAKSFLHKNRWCCANPKSWGTTPPRLADLSCEVYA